MNDEELKIVETEEYKVINKLEFKTKCGKTLWLCECKCGRKQHLTTNDINNGRRRKCLNCANRKYVGKISGYLFNKIRLSAIARKISFNITHEQLWNLYEQQNQKCKLSGIDLVFADTRSEQSQGITTASLDRIDSSLGYEINNIQWIHKDINMMKQRFSQEYFIEVCKKIARNNDA